MQRCTVPGCGRFARAGHHHCSRHPPDHEASDGHPEETGAENGHAAFRSRLATGDYEAVIGTALRRVLHDAAASPNLDEEIGALRVSLARLLQEERDPSRLAAGVARLTGVAVQAAKLRHGGNAEADGIRAILERTLAEMEGEAMADSQGNDVRLSPAPKPS
jgi:hypothetical protein